MTVSSLTTTEASGRPYRPRWHWTKLAIVPVAIGVAVIVAALAWWALVYGIVVNAGVLSLREAGHCLVDSSGLCQAIAVLCARDHPFGLGAYAPELLWTGLGLTGSGLILTAVTRLRTPVPEPASRRPARGGSRRFFSRAARRSGGVLRRAGK